MRLPTIRTRPRGFEREAKCSPRLIHPNIASIYGLEAGALVMGLVEGDSPKGRCPSAMRGPSLLYSTSFRTSYLGIFAE
jgi:hypothetical protein